MSNESYTVKQEVPVDSSACVEYRLDAVEEEVGSMRSGVRARRLASFGIAQVRKIKSN